MRKVHAAVFIAAAILMSASLAAAAKPGPCLPDPPVNLVCAPGAEGVDFSWDDLAEANKYSLDVEIDDGVEVMEYSFSATESMLSVGFSEFMTCGEARAKVINPVGEFNTVEVDVQGGDMVIKLNGTVVSTVGDCELTSGPIGFQSEGAETHWRNIRIREK